MEDKTKKLKKVNVFQDLIEFDGLTIELASPEDILDWSHGEVTKPETINYRTWRPEKNGLFCEKIFGPVRDYECYCGKYKKIRYRGVVCDKCGVEVTHSRVRRERMGHMTLAAPVLHLWFLRNGFSPLTLLLEVSRKDLESVVYFASHLVVEVDKKGRKAAVASINVGIEARKQEVVNETRQEIDGLKDALEKEKKKLAKNIKDKEQLTLAQQEVEVRFRQKKQRLENKKIIRQEKLKSLGRLLEDRVKSLEVLSVLSEEELYYLSQFGADSFFVTNMGAEAILKVLENIDLVSEVKRLRIIFKKTSSKQRKRKLMKRIKLMNGMIKAKVDPSWMIIRILPIVPPDLRPMVQLTGGRFATSDLNDLYRRVINRNNRLKRLMELGAPEIILRNEKRMLQEAVDILIDATKSFHKRKFSKRVPRSLSDLLKGKKGRFRRNLLGKRVDYSGRSVIVVSPELKLDQCGLPKEMALEMFKPFVLREVILRGLAPNIRSAKNLVDHQTAEIYDILEEIVKDKLVLLNRAPTLHKLSMQAFQPVLVDGSAIRIHPCICSGFNADFDGDQMGVHLPLSDVAQEEARNLMLPSKNLLKPSDGRPVDLPAKEMAVGCYYITSLRMEDVELEKEGDINKVKFFVDPKDAQIAWEEDKIDLRQLIGVRIDGKDTLTTLGRILFNRLLPEELRFINEPVSYDQVKELVAKAYNFLDGSVVADMIDSLKTIGFFGANRSGISPAIFDCLVSPEKDKLITKTEEKVSEIEENYNQGLITEDEKNHLIQTMWIETTDEIANLTWSRFSYGSPIKLIADAKAGRISRDQIKQLSGMRGLVVDPLGRIVPLPTKSNFRQGLSVFEYVTGARGSRKGLTDTALKTADAGYLTRRLVDVTHACIIREEDCQTTKKLIINRDDKRKQSFTKRLLSRYLADNVVDPKTKKVILKQGELLDEENIVKIEKAQVVEVAVRTPLFCRSKYGVCAKCYGWDMSNRKQVEIGVPVGVIAAQSIGEPGTQLTLRTKHIGGVVGLDVTQGLPRVQELLEVRTPKMLSPLAKINGKVKVTETAEGYNVVVAGRNGNKKETVSYVVPVTSNLFVKTGDLVAKGAQLSSGALDINEILRIKGIEAAQIYLLDGVQSVYESQSIGIHDKHFEVVIREMSSRIRVTDPGDTDFLVGEYIEKPIFDGENETIIARNGRPAKGRRVILGLIKAALHTNSWLSAASFQQTTNILTEAAVLGKKDNLVGLKENVIIGRLIPVSKERARLK